MASLNAASTFASVALVCIQPLFVAAFSGVLLHEPMPRAARPGALTALWGAPSSAKAATGKGISWPWPGPALPPSRLALPCGPGAGKHPAGGAGGGHALGDALFQRVSYAPGGSGGRRGAAGALPLSPGRYKACRAKLIFSTTSVKNIYIKLSFTTFAHISRHKTRSFTTLNSQ